jgi:hypothetical protein
MLHGEDLRRVLRQICAVPMPPPPDEQTIARYERAERSRKAPTPAAAAHREKQKAAQAASIARSIANRPEGCITVQEILQRSGYSSDYGWRSKCQKHGIWRESYDGVHAWYSEAKLKAAGII